MKIKSLAILVAGLCLTLINIDRVFAQTSVTQYSENRGSSEERFVRRIIPQASAIFSDYVGGDSTHYLNKNGFSIGALADFGSGYYFVGESGLLYRSLNASNQNTFGNTDYTNNYLSVPVSLKYYASGQENSSLYVKLGVMGSTLASSSATSSPGYAGSVYTYKNRDFELSGLGGLGYKFFLSPTSDLIVEGTYTRGTDSIFNNATVYNAAWNLSAGVSVNL